MVMSEAKYRSTRSRSRQPSTPARNPFSKQNHDSTPGPTAAYPAPRPPQNAYPISTLSNNLTPARTGLKPEEHTLLLRKQSLLRSTTLTNSESPPITNAITATLVFAAHQAGTAVCVSPSGLLLTASHCVAETPVELDHAKQEPPWLLFSDGRAVRAVPLHWDPRRDLVLMHVTHAQTPGEAFPSIPVSPSQIPVNSPLICVGHPGSEDLEAAADSSGKRKATGYDVLCVSRGRYRGMDPRQDAQDNSEIGALRHDCWTYWGHSGAPLVVDEGTRRRKKGEAEAEMGMLVGLHTSWDEGTGMRRGLGLEVLWGFLEEWEGSVGGGVKKGVEVVDLTGE